MRSIGLAAKSSENMFSSGGISVEDLTTSPRRCAPKMLVQPAAHGAVPDAREINALATAGGAPAGSPHAEPGRQAGGAAQRLRRCASVRWYRLRVRWAGAHPHALTGQRAPVRLGVTDAENCLARARSLPACPGSGGTSSAKRRSGLLGMCMTLRTAPIRTRWPSGSRS